MPLFTTCPPATALATEPQRGGRLRLPPAKTGDVPRHFRFADLRFAVRRFAAFFLAGFFFAGFRFAGFLRVVFLANVLLLSMLSRESARAHFSPTSELTTR